MKAIILVGGPIKGTRFRPLSLDIPKPLCSIAGRPMIHHQVEACAQVEGVKEIILIGFYPESQFANFIGETSKEFNMKIRYLNEVKVLGTAGGLNYFRDQIMEGNPTHLFVLHSDICCTFPLKELLQFHKAHGKTCTIMGTQVPKEFASLYGCLIKDPETNELQHYAEKPETFVSDLINCGIYCWSASFFEGIAKVKLHKSQEIHFDDEMFNPNVMHLETDVYTKMAGTKTIYVYPYTGFWREIKNAGGSVYATDMYLKHFATAKPHLLTPKSEIIRGNVIVHPSAQIHPKARIGPNVTIGANVKVGKGVRIANSIVLDGAEIKESACILYTILGWDCVVNPWSRIEGIPNFTPVMSTDGKRQGVTVVGRGTVIAREILIRNCIVMPHKELNATYLNEILL